MMALLLASGAVLEKSITRVREIYHLPEHRHAELIIDTLHSAHDTLEYAELECPSEEELMEILEKVFHLNLDFLSDEGIK